MDDRLFYDLTQARQAYTYLETAMEQLENDFPSNDNYVKEYAIFMKSMADEVEK